MMEVHLYDPFIHEDLRDLMVEQGIRFTCKSSKTLDFLRKPVLVVDGKKLDKEQALLWIGQQMVKKRKGRV